MDKRKIVVFGEDCRDIFVYGRATRLAPDGPFPVFITEDKEENVGCAANVVRNLSSLSDNDYEIIFIHNYFPIYKTRYVDKASNYTLLRHDENDVQPLITNDALSSGLEAIYRAEAVVISDYNKGFLNNEAIYTILQYAFREGVSTFVDTKKLLHKETFGSASFIKINETEYDFNIKNGVNLKYTRSNLIVTRGERGMEWNKQIYPTTKVEVRDLSGAGDTAMAGLVVGFNDYCDIIPAIEFANKAAAVAVSKKGVVAVKREEVL